ncbi:MAG: FtsX-like permease family protein [Rikenellaceae bacterium]
MRTILLIAKRYLFSRGSHSVVNTISAVSLVSLMLPVAAVIILLSIFNGFGSLVEVLNGATSSDVTVQLRRGNHFAMNDIDVSQLRAIYGVESLSFVTEQTVMVEHRSRAIVVTLRGVDEEYSSVVDIEGFVGVGSFGGDDDSWIVLSGSMPYQLGISRLSDGELTLYSLRTGRLQSFMPLPNFHSQHGEVSGVVYIDEEHDQRYGYTSQSALNQLLGREGVATKLLFKVDRSRESEVIQSIERVVGGEYEVLSRVELNSTLFEVVKYEKYAIMIIALLVISLAAFTLMGAETMLIVERRRDISTLAMLGLSQSYLRGVFVLWGAIIGSISIVVGLILGVGVSLMQQHLELLMLPVTSTMAMAYPVQVQLGDILYVVLVSGGVTMILSYVVARVLIVKER